MIERMGGKLDGLWFAFGEFDVVCIAEMPDNVTAAAISMAIGSTGTMSTFRSSPLMTSAEAVEAMKKAAAVAYPAPQ
jgi:uncharacterized protein with GYD domain